MKLSDVTRAGRQSAAELGANLEAIRASIATLTDERERVSAQPVPKEVAVERIRIWVAQKTEPLDTFYVKAFAAAEDYRAPHVDPNSSRMMVAVAAEVAGGRLLRGVGEFYANNPGISDVDRAAALAKIGIEMLELELAEESLIRDGESAGMRILRRADADPRAVLAAASSLP